MDHFLSNLFQVIKDDSSPSENDELPNDKAAMLNRLRKVNPEETEIVLDLGVVADGKIGIVANLGSTNVDQLNEDLKKDLNITEEEKTSLPKIRIKPIETMLKKSESSESEQN